MPYIHPMRIRKKSKFIKKGKRNKWIKGCVNKWRYRTFNLAEKARYKLHYGEELNEYLCEFCGWWHLGHLPK